MPLTPAPTFAVRQSTTGGVRRVAGFGPRRDAEARRLPFLAVNRFDSASTWTLRSNPMARAHCQTWSNMALWQAGEGQWDVSPGPPLPPPLRLRGKLGRMKKAWMAGLGGRLAPPCWGPTSRQAQACTSTTWPCGEGRARCLTTYPTPTGASFRNTPTLPWWSFNSEATPCPPSPTRKVRGAMRRKWAKTSATSKPNGPGCPSCSSAPPTWGKNLNTYPGLQHTVTALRDTALANHALHWDLQAVMGGPGAMKRWVDQRWAGDDHVHFSVRGAQEAAQRLIQALAHERALWANRRIQPAKLMEP